MQIDPPLQAYVAENLVSGFARPTTGPNAWAAKLDDPAPCVTLRWSEPQRIGRMELSFDADFDHPMESVLMGHPEDVMPFCVRNYRIFNDQDELLHQRIDNYQTRNTVRFQRTVVTGALKIAVDPPNRAVPAALFEVRCYTE